MRTQPPELTVEEQWKALNALTTYLHDAIKAKPLRLGTTVLPTQVAFLWHEEEGPDEPPLPTCVGVLWLQGGRNRQLSDLYHLYSEDDCYQVWQQVGEYVMVAHKAYTANCTRKKLPSKDHIFVCSNRGWPQLHVSSNPLTRVGEDETYVKIPDPNHLLRIVFNDA